MSRAGQIVVAGGGPAGLAAAAAAARRGASLLLYEEQPALGGQLRYRAQPVDVGEGVPAERPGELAARLVDVAVEAGAMIHTNALVAGRFGEGALLVAAPGGTRALTPEAFIVTTGSTDLPFPFPGATYPGVFSRRAVQILLNQHRALPGRRFAIIGSGPEVDELEVDILLAGGEVVWRGIAPPPVLRAEGEAGVRTLRVGDGVFDVDIVAIAVGRQADAALATMAGAALAFSAELGGWVPVADERMATTAPRLFVAGDAAGAGSVAAALVEGHLAGVAAAAALGLASQDEVTRAREAGGPELARRIGVRAELTPAYQQPFAAKER